MFCHVLICCQLNYFFMLYCCHLKTCFQLVEIKDQTRRFCPSMELVNLVHERGLVNRSPITQMADTNITTGLMHTASNTV